MCSAAYLLKSPSDSVVKGRRPYTKLQQRCLDMQGSLPPITDAQLRWGRNTITPKGYFVRHGRGGNHSFIWCQECGHMDEVEMSTLYVSVANPVHTCPNCGKKLSLYHHAYSNKWVSEYHPFCIVTTIQDMQVARVFYISRSNTMGHETVEHLIEAFSIFFEPGKGKEVIVSKPYTRGWNNFRWHMTEPFKIGRHNGGCSGYYVYDDLYDIRDVPVYPRMKVLPILRRNGYTPAMCRMKASQIDIWRALLNDPAAEGLAKTGQLAVLDYWFSTGSPNRDKSAWLPLVKICNRRKYIIRDANLWFDTVESLRKLGMDDHSPKYICPDDLKAMHDLLQRRIENRRMREEIRKLRSDAKNWEEFYQEKKARFFGIEFNDGNIFCHVIRSVEEMCEEGTKMHHCVYRMGYYKKPDSLILSARDRNGDRLETVEVNLRTFSVVQSRGLQNVRTTAHDSIVRLVKDNMNLIRRASKTNNRIRV